MLSLRERFSRTSALLVAAGVVAMSSAPALALDDAHKAKAEAVIAKAEAYLKTQQDEATGGWMPPPATKEGEKAPPHMPAISGLVLTGMLLDPAADPSKDESLRKGIGYLLRFQQEDGGIYDAILPNYNTAICVSALSRVDSPEARQAVRRGVEFLKKLQWGESADEAASKGEAKAVGKDHPYYGGVGYGHHGRPDNSNLSMFLEALKDADVSPSDPTVQRALVFLSRTQMLDETNDMPFADGSRQGGFVYSVTENAASVDGRAGQSNAGTIEETLSDGTVASKLRCYGSMTYAGFKSLVYAQLPKDDPRVVAAKGWIQRHYTLDENPGIGTDGLYYYYVTFARALDASGEEVVMAIDAPASSPYDSAATMSSPAVARDWANELIDKLASMQNDDGSFKSVDDRWMENNPVLITAYSVIALRHAAR